MHHRFEVLFNAHARMVYRTAYGITRSHADAEDVLQQIFLQLIRRPAPPDIESNSESYFYRAAVNTSLNILKLRRREVPTEDKRLLADPASTGPPNGLHEWLHEAIAELEPESAQLLILRYMHGKSDAEIGRLLGKSRGSVALKLFRLRARLKKRLSIHLGR